MQYSEQIKSPKWQKKRLEILKRDEFTCQECGNKEQTLHVHHKHYNKGAKIWEYEGWELTTLCETCHSKTHDKPGEKKYTDLQLGIMAYVVELEYEEQNNIFKMLQIYANNLKSDLAFCNIFELLVYAFERDYIAEEILLNIKRLFVVSGQMEEIERLKEQIGYMVIDEKKYAEHLEKYKILPF